MIINKIVRIVLTCIAMTAATSLLMSCDKTHDSKSSSGYGGTGAAGGHGGGHGGGVGGGSGR